MSVPKTLEEAALTLDPQRTLNPKNQEEFDHYYIQRPDTEVSKLIYNSKVALKGQRPFHWFFTGHTGAGKSTELNLLVQHP